jgi:hypothetical protein
LGLGTIFTTLFFNTFSLCSSPNVRPSFISTLIDGQNCSSLHLNLYALSGRRWKYDFKLGLQGMGCDHVEWIHLAQDGLWWCVW